MHKRSQKARNKHKVTMRILKNKNVKSPKIKLNPIWSMVARSKRGIDPENNLCWEKCRVRITRLQTAALSHEVTFRCKSPIQQTYNTLTQQVTLYFSCFFLLWLFQLNKSPSIASSYGYSPWPINCSDPWIEQDRENISYSKRTNFSALIHTLPFSQLQFCKSDMLMANFMIDQKMKEQKK